MARINNCDLGSKTDLSAEVDTPQKNQTTGRTLLKWIGYGIAGIASVGLTALGIANLLGDGESLSDLEDSDNFAVDLLQSTDVTHTQKNILGLSVTPGADNLTAESADQLVFQSSDNLNVSAINRDSYSQVDFTSLLTEQSSL